LNVLNDWFPAGGDVSGGYKNFRKWGLAGGSRSLGAPSFLLPIHCELSATATNSCHHDTWQTQKYGAKWPQSEPSKTISTNQSFHCQ
jgi:hypothetical protein